MAEVAEFKETFDIGQSAESNDDNNSVNNPMDSSSSTSSANDFIPDRAARRKQVNDYLTKYEEEEKLKNRSELGSFKQIQKRRLLNEIIRAHQGPNGEPYALVLDQLSTFLLSTQLSMNDIMYPKESVVLVENITKKRQPNPFMEAVYLLQPSKESIDALVADFASETGIAQYSGIHIILTGKCPKEGIAMIKATSRLVRHMITFRELAIDVFPIESHLINFGLPSSLNQMFGHGHSDPTKHDVSAHYQLIADRVVSVCSTLHEIPYVRIANHNKRSNVFYECFTEKMKEFSRNNQEWKWHDGEGTGNGIDQRATLIVLDRRDDLASILRHDFTYQVSKFFFHF